jgi:hypothetical protein
MRLRFPEAVQDVRHHGADGTSISESNIARAGIECLATRCVTVENKTSLHQRALQTPDVLHIHTSYPGAAALALLRKLPRSMEFLHSGDTDPAGFDILRDLRQSTGLPIRPLGMDFVECADSPPLTAEETTLLENLMDDPLLLEERPALHAMLTNKCKGVFEQEHHER